MSGLFGAIKGDIKAHMNPTKNGLILGPGLDRIINPKPSTDVRRATILSSDPAVPKQTIRSSVGASLGNSAGDGGL